MQYKAKLNFKFYLVTLLLSAAVALIVWFVYGLLTERIALGGGEYFQAREQAIIAMLVCLIGSSWVFSLITLLRQILRGYAFIADENGIHNTLTLKIVFSVILVVPVKNIPYSAVRYRTELYSEDEINQIADKFRKKRVTITTLALDKSKIDVAKPLRPFAGGMYTLCSGFTAEKSAAVLEKLKAIPAFSAIPERAVDN